MYYIFGLGNPGEEYGNSRHNAGRMAVLAFVKKNDFDEPKFDKKINALVADGKIGKESVKIVLPETFMNKSGVSAKWLIKSKKDAAKLIVCHDDLDLGLGSFKISFGKSAGGHKGVESIVKVIKTLDFTRIRVGVSPATPKGKVKRPDAAKMVDFIIGNFKPLEKDTLKKVFKNISEAMELAVTEGEQRAMSEFN